MCIAILNISKPLTREQLNNSWTNNSQGAGLLYNINGKLTTYKSYNKKQFIKEYYRVRKQVKGKIVLHFRIATSGHEKYTNLHPFLVSEKLGFVHNGIIPKLGDNRYSDTYYFNETLKQMHPDFLTCEKSIQHIVKTIGYSKLVFLDNEDKHTIVNEHMGHWVSDNWYSNDSYTSYLDYEYYGNVKVSKKKSRASDDFDFDLDWRNTDYASYYKPAQPAQPAQPACKAASQFSKEDEHYFNDFMTYFVNASEHIVSSIEYITGLNRLSSEFSDLVEDFSYLCDTIDLVKIHNAIQAEYERKIEQEHEERLRWY